MRRGWWRPLGAALLIGPALLVGAAAPWGGDAWPAASKRASAPAGTRLYEWYDGDQRREAWLDPNVVAEFRPSTEGGTALLRAYPAARAVDGGTPAVRFWRIGPGEAPETATRALNARAGRGRFSPVFRDVEAPSGRRRALPGNVIVYLDPAWDAAAVDRWVRGRGLRVVRRLEVAPNVLVVATGPGLEALDTAEALRRSGEVKAALPDWWEEFTLR